MYSSSFSLNVLPVNILRKIRNHNICSFSFHLNFFCQSIWASSCFNSQVIVAFETRLVIIMRFISERIKKGWYGGVSHLKGQQPPKSWPKFNNFRIILKLKDLKFEKTCDNFDPYFRREKNFTSLVNSVNFRLCNRIGAGQVWLKFDLYSKQSLTKNVKKLKLGTFFWFLCFRFI